ncbi:MAG: glycoside hydrolase family 130 protein [Desulfobacterales bacterium]|nr:MAG: glycoside hydrolase family 130 protein [Desulfobacterales bacterium]
MPEEKCRQILQSVLRDFSDRHMDLEGALIRHYDRIEALIAKAENFSRERKLLLGSFFTKEYSIESVAFFNPSIVQHPNQDDLPEGFLRVISSFRAVGEGHISSLTFRSGILDRKDNLMMEPVSPFLETPTVALNPTYDKKVFLMILKDELDCNDIVYQLFDNLPDQFRFDQLKKRIEEFKAEQVLSSERRETVEMIYWIARSNFVQSFRAESRLSERVIFPTGRNESNGIEDARFVRFVDDDGDIRYYATFTAYNGRNILPMLLETRDFLKFKMLTLNGDAVRDKGMALFPRKINGKYMMISRQDGENLYIMSSDHIHLWESTQILKRPQYSWEFVQIGNCGSPLETKDGWLLLTHGVGAMRKYCIGASLLDLNDPSRVIGQLEEPIIIPNEYEREGYVPNVVYTCGSIIHNNTLVIPYAVSDTTSGIATIELKPLLEKLSHKPLIGPMVDSS